MCITDFVTTSNERITVSRDFDIEYIAGEIYHISVAQVKKTILNVEAFSDFRIGALMETTNYISCIEISVSTGRITIFVNGTSGATISHSESMVPNNNSRRYRLYA